MHPSHVMQLRTPFYLLALASLPWSSCATGGGGPDVIRPRSGITAAEYYPLTDGWKWAYDVEQDGTNILATYAVVEVKEKLSVIQAGDERLTYLVAPDGVAQFDGNAIGGLAIGESRETMVTRAEPARITRTVFAPGLGPVAIEMQVQEGPKFVTKVKARLRAVTKPGDALATP